MENSYKVNYNIKDLNTWLVEGKQGKKFYSISLPEQVGIEMYPGKKVKLSFTTSEKFVYNNDFGKAGDKSLFIIPNFEYNINVWDEENKVSLTATDQSKIIISGKRMLEVIGQYVPNVKIIETKPKVKNLINIPNHTNLPTL